MVKKNLVQRNKEKSVIIITLFYGAGAKRSLLHFSFYALSVQTTGKGVVFTIMVEEQTEI